jgi:hypothetical protein
MKGLSRCLMLAALALAAAAFASATWGRGGRGGTGAGAGRSNLCASTTMLDVTLSNVDGLIKTSGSQTTALEELKRIAKENAGNMSRVCNSDSPMSFTAKLAAAQKRLDVALDGARRLKPVADKFYATLDSEQKALVDDLVFWPGL